MISLTSQTWAEKQGYLGDDARCLVLRIEQPPIRFQSIHPFLHPEPSRVIHTHKGPSLLFSELNRVRKFPAMGFAKTPTHTCVIFTGGNYISSVHLPKPGYHSIGRNIPLIHAEFSGPMGDKGPYFRKRTRIKQIIDSLTGIHKPLFTAFFQCRGATHLHNFGTPLAPIIHTFFITSSGIFTHSNH